MTDFKKIYDMYMEFTNNYFEGKKTEEIKSKSQYFTPIEEADMLIEDIEIKRIDTVKILDPACGNGILLIKILEKIISNNDKLRTIIIHIYEIEAELLDNVKYLMSTIKFNHINFQIEFYNEDFLNSANNVKYDYIIMNPPYKKINAKDVPKDLDKFLYGQPNLYHLFITKALELVEENGLICIISPKNYLSGKYTEKLRKYIIKNFSMVKIHTFNDRNKYFSNNITQEVCIVHIKKSDEQDIIISYNDEAKFIVNKNDIILGGDKFIVATPRSLEDYDLLNKFKKFPVGTIGKDILVKVGKVVQFRVKGKDINLRDKEFTNYRNGMPLIVYRHISGREINYRTLGDKRKNNAITLINDGSNVSLIINNSNYLMIRKNIDKKYDKLIHAISYLKSLKSDKLAIDNSILYITNKSDSLSKEIIVGLKFIFMSKFFDDYYRMVNSSHTINVYELENMHFPDIQTVYSIGDYVIQNSIKLEEATEVMSKYI